MEPTPTYNGSAEDKLRHLFEQESSVRQQAFELIANNPPLPLDTHTTWNTPGHDGA
jgi:hypothetical protein